MAFSTGNNSVTFSEISSKVNEAELVSTYLGITEIPCIISSPLRQDKNPSFGLYSSDGKRIRWVDLATKERGGIYDLLFKLWNCSSYSEVLTRISKDLSKFTTGAKINNYVPSIVQDTLAHSSNSDLQCKVREWRNYDIEYWESYGISLEWLKYADVYPISHKIIIKNNSRYVFGADKYAYAYVERKEGNITLKIYQPFNKQGHKWANKHDRSVISLWAKIPERGDRVVICSSLKDALCLWANTGIPAVAVQGEGYSMSNTAIEELKRRYTNVYILFDNDEAGLSDGVKLSEQTGFTNIVLPYFEGGKDVSDLFKSVGKQKFHVILMSLFDDTDRENDPFSLPF